MYRETTENVLIEVLPTYMEEESSRVGQHLYQYKIKITNKRDESVQLLSRHWVIRYSFKGSMETREVEGPGVVGETPIIEPGKTFEYSSFCPLPTPHGSMRGTYLMETQNGAKFEAKVPLFFLRPQTLSDSSVDQTVH